MIPILLRDLVPRLVVVVLVAWLLYLLEPGFHQHGPLPADPDVAIALGPLGVSATLANLAGLSMLILLAGFIANDRRQGFYRIYFSHPVHPLAFYGVRWLLALALAMLAATLFLVIGQLAAWGEWRGGAAGLQLALLSAVAYGGLVAFLSTVLPRGDAWIAILAYVFSYVWLQVLALGAEPLTRPVRQAITLLLPPLPALGAFYDTLLAGQPDRAAAAFALGYGVFWLLSAALLLRLREWP